MAIKKAGVEFFIKIDTNKDLIGKAANFTASYIDDATGVVTTIMDSFVEVQISGNGIGVYRCPLTIPAVGDYTIISENQIDNMENLAFSVEVTHATIDDVETLINALQSDLTAVKGQVDTLDEAELNGISEQVTAVKSTVDNIKTLIDDEDGTAVNSVMEFVTAINTALESGASGLDVLASYTDNLELMLEGKAYTNTDGVEVTEAESKGLIEIFAAIVAANDDVDAANTAIADLSTKLTGVSTTIQTAVSDARTAIETAITNAKDSLSASIAAVKAVVDTNQAHLEDAGYGLSALKGLIDNVDADIGLLSTEMGSRFDTVDATLTSIGTSLTAARTAIQDDIAALSSNMGTRFDTVDATLAAMGSTTTYKGFV